MQLIELIANTTAITNDVETREEDQNKLHNIAVYRDRTFERMMGNGNK